MSFWFRKPTEPQATYGAENGGVDFKPSQPTKKIVSVLPALCKTFGAEFCLGAILKLVQDLLAFVSPQILRFVPTLICFIKFSSCSEIRYFSQFTDHFRSWPIARKLERLPICIHSNNYGNASNLVPWTVLSAHVRYWHANKNFDCIVGLPKSILDSITDIFCSSLSKYILF